MTERPILMSAPMVRAILEGRKTQTRRVVSPEPRFEKGYWCSRGYVWKNGISQSIERSPYGAPGDRLWVREKWRADSYAPEETIYHADAPADVARDIKGIIKFRPSIHMPRTRSRITLEIVNVRVERLQDIDEADAEAEGVDRRGPNDQHGDERSFYNGYHELWDAINAKRDYGWDVNPWVWVIEFKRL